MKDGSLAENGTTCCCRVYVLCSVMPLDARLWPRGPCTLTDERGREERTCVELTEPCERVKRCFMYVRKKAKHRVPARRHLGLMSARDLFDSAEPRARDLFTMSPPTLLTRQTTSDRDADLVYALALAETEERQARENASMTYAQRGILDDRADIEDEVDGCEFFFLPSSTIRHTQRFTPTGITELPRFQELRERHLVRRFVSRREAMSQRGELRETCLAVSHRWESTLRPDVTGDQFRAIRAYLDEHPQIEYVWVDWSSMPQRAPTATSGREKRGALQKRCYGRSTCSFLAAPYCCSSTFRSVRASGPCLRRGWRCRPPRPMASRRSASAHAADTRLNACTRRP